jgi:hypothetical protein
MPNSKPGQNAKSLSNAQLCQTSSPKNRPLDSTKTLKMTPRTYYSRTENNAGEFFFLPTTSSQPLQSKTATPMAIPPVEAKGNPARAPPAESGRNRSSLLFSNWMVSAQDAETLDSKFRHECSFVRSFGTNQTLSLIFGRAKQFTFLRSLLTLSGQQYRCDGLLATARATLKVGSSVWQSADYPFFVPQDKIACSVIGDRSEYSFSVETIVDTDARRAIGNLTKSKTASFSLVNGSKGREAMDIPLDGFAEALQGGSCPSINFAKYLSRR